ncbi:hypothetical protein VP01_1416g4 [Puccinia sorghi]|uniref:Uncharacterized protein n=1 Tax=Puccinia sorghi TaxID=27349 RepID=A0A0L6VLB6_9BASI|nr:hypothetical protein VP01_1416g4 [Puccinia sorghi]
MKTFFFGLLYLLCGLATEQVVVAPVIFFPPNLALYYPLQYMYGTAFRDFGEYMRPEGLSVFIDKMDPARNLKKNIHHPLYGGKFPEGFSAVDLAVVAENSPEVANPAHQTFTQLLKDK